MRLYQQILITAVLTVAARAQNQICLFAVPESLRVTLEQDHWTILHPEDLAPDDIPVWKNHHPGYCPGVARGNFHHNSNPTYVIALIRKAGDPHPGVTEKVIVVTFKKRKTETETVVPPTDLPAPAVVWSLPSHRYLGVDGKRVFIPQDSFAYERLVGTSRQYYYAGSHLKSFQMSY